MFPLLLLIATMQSSVLNPEEDGAAVTATTVSPLRLAATHVVDVGIGNVCFGERVPVLLCLSAGEG